MTRAERLNRAPIFLNCMSRGGSNIFWNLFLSHPDACSPIRETLEIFRSDWRAPTWTGLRLALASGQPRLFDQWNLRPRRPVRAGIARFIDRTFHLHKLRTLTDPEMRFKTPDAAYNAEEVEGARLTAKNNNGLVFLTEVLGEIYPDATFFALARHPLALYESHKRRRIHRSPEAFAEFYVKVAGKMIADAERYERAHLTRFEDVLADPLGSLGELYGKAGLDAGKIDRLRFKSKRHYLPDGTRGADLEVGRHHWFGLDEVGGFFEPAINELQATRLDRGERGVVLERTAAVLERLGYGRDGVA